jgi:hypothetical protein
VIYIILAFFPPAETGLRGDSVRERERERHVEFRVTHVRSIMESLNDKNHVTPLPSRLTPNPNKISLCEGFDSLKLRFERNNSLVPFR